MTVRPQYIIVAGVNGAGNQHFIEQYRNSFKIHNELMLMKFLNKNGGDWQKTQII